MVTCAFTLDTTSPRSKSYYIDAISRAIEVDELARRVASRSSSAVLVTVPSQKMSRVFSAESAGEAIAMRTVDVSEDIAAFGPQKALVLYRYGSSIRRAYPDLAVQYLDGTVGFWEIKAERKSKDLVRRLRSLRAQLASCGIRYDVFTPSWLKQEPRMSNVQALFRQANRELSVATKHSIAAHLSFVSNLGELHTAAKCSIGELYAGIAQGLVAADIEDVPLGCLTKVQNTRMGARSGARIRYWED